MTRKQKGDPKDPRYRPFRIGMYVAYVAICATFCGLVIFSVVRSVLEMSPRRRSDSDVTLSVRECVENANALWGDLEQHRKDLTTNNPAATADQTWSSFRVSWLRQLRELDAQCATRAQAREPLRTLFKRLEQVMDLYTTHAVQYAGEVGSAVDKLRAAFDAARAQLPVGKLP